jgi:hypothetical protein
MSRTPGRGARAAPLLLAVALAGCSTPPVQVEPAVAASPWAQQSAVAGGTAGPPAAPAWAHHGLPGKAPAQFRYVLKDGRHAMAAVAASSASMLRRKVRIEPAELGLMRFSWKVPALIPDADLGLREAADSPVRVILAFEGDRSGFSARDSLMAELSRSLTGEEMPYATLMYVWCNTRAPGTVIANPRTGRIRSLVLESGPTRLNRWLDYERDIRADFRRAFGEEPGALVGVAIMTDSDNTGSVARAWYGPLKFSRARAPGHN